MNRVELMEMRALGTSVDDWRPARKFPETYPGLSVDRSYLLWHDRVLPISTGEYGEYLVTLGSSRLLLEDLLGELRLPGLEQRFPVLAYGANRNPSTLYTKLLNYSSRDGGTNGHCLPVLKGRIQGADVAACRFHGHGYLYGEILLGHSLCKNVELEVYVCLVDLEQLAVLNQSEGVGAGLYELAVIPEVLVDDLPQPFSALGYAANQSVWLSPVHETPVAYSLLSATDRILPSMTSREMVDHVMDSLGLRGQISALTGLKNDGRLAEEVAKYLNGQWWYQFHTGEAPIRGYRQVLELFDSRMSAKSAQSRTLDSLRANGLVLSHKDAYAPGREHLWKNRYEAV
ncbi:hypothetical protein RKE29_02980 [Streptomyces sp. B1866]|uniref:hypothetical protein n=1 Tax=Streptomyces sp. B1866 TaxID=3075431 RepID=UPI00288E7A22|nr:hypothetical protein [Streptomyces sp. B1866]MDT3395622.1 hypothetical protein [Streptomyces sp. B1866]